MSTFETSGENEDNFSLEEIGQLYLGAAMNEWEEAYSQFQELEIAGKREFVYRKPTTTVQVYNEMMDRVNDALGLDEEYESSVEEVTNAFIYSANNDVEFDEFRRASKNVLKGEKKWLDYASSNF